MILDCYVLAFEVAGFVEPFPKRRGKSGGRVGRPISDESNHRHCRLLCARHKRPRRCRAAEQRDEVAPFHSITSSAMASSPGGKLRPNILAVLRLITNSNLVGCMTGRSAGFSPLRIRPVYTPACRYEPVMLVP